MGNSADRVLRINEVYHDVEGAAYQDKHPGIFENKHLSNFWEDVATAFLSGRSKPLKILDIGTGTGYVPLHVGEYLKATDSIVCADISEAMLEACADNLERRRYACSFEFLKSSGTELEMGDDEVDCVTANALLHHIPNLAAFFAEVRRVLKPGGVLVVANEPNKQFYNHAFLWNNYRIIKGVYDLREPRKVLVRFLRRLGLLKAMQKAYRSVKPKRPQDVSLVDRVNERLLREKVIDSPLTGTQLSKLVDVHSPTAGGDRQIEKGFAPAQLIREYLPEFQLEMFGTYNHLCKVSHINSFTRAYDRLLKEIYPEAGANFMMVVRNVGAKTFHEA